MKIFLTGATGYIGEELLKALLQQGHTVHAVVRNKEERSLLSHPNLTWFEGDLLNLQSILHAMHQCEQVYHTAAYARVYAKDPLMYHQQNVIAAGNVFYAAWQLKIDKLVFTSSAGVIGPTGNEVADENSSRKTGFLNEYEETKALAEQLAITYSKKGLPVVIVNPSRVYGPGKTSRSNPFLSVVRMLLKSPVVFIPGDGKGVGSYSFIEDVVQGHLLAMQHGRSGERYIIGGENVSYNELFRTIMKAANREVQVVHIPLALITAFSQVELLRAKSGNHEPWIVPKWVKKYTYHAAYSSEKAIAELNYRITPLQVGMEKTIAFIKA